MQLGTRLLTLSVGGTDFTDVVNDVEIVSSAADSDFLSFAAAATGGARKYWLKFNAVQDPATGSLWDKVWTSAGTSVAFILRPAGGTTPSPTQPHFTGNCIVTEPDGTLLGGQANSSTTSRFQFAPQWECTAKPTRLTA